MRAIETDGLILPVKDVYYPPKIVVNNLYQLRCMEGQEITLTLFTRNTLTNPMWAKGTQTT